MLLAKSIKDEKRKILLSTIYRRERICRAQVPINDSCGVVRVGDAHSCKVGAGLWGGKLCWGKKFDDLRAAGEREEGATI